MRWTDHPRLDIDSLPPLCDSWSHSVVVLRSIFCLCHRKKRTTWTINAFSSTNFSHAHLLTSLSVMRLNFATLMQLNVLKRRKDKQYILIAASDICCLSALWWVSSVTRCVNWSWAVCTCLGVYVLASCSLPDSVCGCWLTLTACGDTGCCRLLNAASTKPGLEFSLFCPRPRSILFITFICCVPNFGRKWKENLAELFFSSLCCTCNESNEDLSDRARIFFFVFYLILLNITLNSYLNYLGKGYLKLLIDLLT